MRRLISCEVTVAMVLGSFLVTAGPSQAEGNAPAWSPNDYWEYTTSGTVGIQTISAVIRFTVMEKTSVTVGAATYESWHSKVSVTISTMGVSFSASGDDYVRTSTLEIATFTVQYRIGGPPTTITQTFDPPAIGLQFPLTVGKNWSMMTHETTTTPGGTTSANVIFDYNVTRTERTTVAAGTFDTFVVEFTLMGDANNISRMYYSDQVGNAVKMTGSLLGGPLLTLELKSYFYAERAFLRGLWWVLVIMVVVVLVVAIAVVAIRRRRRARLAPPSQPAGSVYGQPPLQQPPPQQPYQPPYQPPQPPPQQP